MVESECVATRLNDIGRGGMGLVRVVRDLEEPAGS